MTTSGKKMAPAEAAADQADFEDSLTRIELPIQQVRLFRKRREESAAKIAVMRQRFVKNPKLQGFPDLTVYAAGSYARGEASAHSDIDLFFVHNDVEKPKVDDPRLKGLRAISAVIQEMEVEMEFPPPSNDGQFFNILRLSDVLLHLGGGEDDYRNNFTARMLLLLESTHVYGEPAYDEIRDRIIESYLRDYEDHSKDFRPTFLVNDTLRFWKTLCLNYEHRRNQLEEEKKIKHKIKKFKLGFSRMATCYATISLLASYKAVGKEDLLRITKLTPIDRFLELERKVPSIRKPLQAALIEYAWFLERTALTSDELLAYFSDKANRTHAFERVGKFGASIYEIVKTTGEERGTLRYLLV